MQAYLLTRHGKPGVLKLVQVKAPEPGEGQVRVRLHTIGLNYAEVLSRKGLYGWAPRRPYIPGMEGYGEIEAIGRNVENRVVGEKVIVGAQSGCYAEKVVVPAHQALPAFASFSAEENAAFAVNYMTAWVALFKMARLQPTDVVLVTAAAGGVGTAAVQLAKHFGCHVIGLAGSQAKIDVLHHLGVDQAINYRQQDFAAAIRSSKDFRGVDVVLETVGGEVYKKCLGLLNPFGRVVIMGFASLNLKKWNPLSWWRTWRDLPKANVQKMAEGSYGVLSSHLGYLLPHPQRLLEIWDQLTAFVIEQKIRPVVGRVFAFDELPAAHAFMESRQSYGKIVLRLQEEPSG